MVKVLHGSATQLPYPDNYFDAVLTDPPYYDNVPYSDLSDFFYCLTPGTLVVTEQGYLPIEQVKVGMRVLSHKGHWTPVDGVSERHYRGDIFSIRVAYCSIPLKITPGHKIRVRKKGAPRGEWIPPEQLREDDFIFVPTCKPGGGTKWIRLSDHLRTHYPADDQWLYYGRVSEETLSIHKALALVPSVSYGDLKRLAASLQVRPDKVRRLRHEGAPTRLRIRNQIPADHDFAAFIGYYLAEGSVTLRTHGRHVINFAFHEQEEEYVREVERLMYKVFEIMGKRRYRPTEKAILLTFHCTPVAEFLAENFGKDSKSKRLPLWFLDLPDDLLAAFVKRFWAGDGSKGNEFYQLTTASASLAGQVRLILQRLGIAAHVYLDDKERLAQWGTKIVRSSSRFLLKVWGKHRRALAQILGTPDTCEQEGRYLIEQDGEGYWVPIRQIEVKDYDGLVYNLSTEDHSYTTIQGCVHNCWLKRTVGDLYPDLFATPLTPKTQEIVEEPGRGKDRKWFGEMLTQAFREIRRVLKPEGIAVIVFAHKTTAAWESVIQALLDAGLYMTASWPIHTEMQARLNAQETASLASSIYMVCRKRTTDEVGEYARVRQDIAARVRRRLNQFWNEGIRGADFFMSAIGPAVEVFGRYARVEKLSGDPVTVAELLEYVQQVVAEFALERVLQSPQLGGVDAETRFYLLWRWTYNHARVPFDEANKLARAVGAEISELWAKSGFVQKDKEYVRVLGPRERAKVGAHGRAPLLERERFTTLVDALHKACILWESNQRQALNEHLALNRGGDETFWRVAQAISDVLPPGDKEKQLLQGLLQARRGYSAPQSQQRALFE